MEIARENEKDEPAQPVQTNIYVNDAPCVEPTATHSFLQFLKHIHAAATRCISPDDSIH